jgi:hypothetical protein
MFLPGVLAELRVLFPRTVEAIVIMSRRYNGKCAERQARWVGCVEDEEGVGGRHAT